MGTVNRRIFLKFFSAGADRNSGEKRMTITTYQIQNVLRTYGNQLKRRASLSEGSVPPVQSSSDLVDISVEARKRQVLSQLSAKLIAKVTSREPQGRTPHDGAGGMKEDQESIFNGVSEKQESIQ
jgi:hypothetical protein